MKIKLEKTELDKLFEIINEYQHIYNEITDIENKIKELTEKQNSLLKSLELNRDKEKKFTNNIIKKYGVGKFNFETLEYELK